MEKQTLIDLLKRNVVPALGCTEPVCVALCAAYAARELTGEITSVSVTVNPGIYKNGMSAGIPNCPEVGLPRAAAIGALLANPEKQLQLLQDLTPELLEKVRSLVNRNSVSVRVDHRQTGLYVRCELRTETETAAATIQGAHTNLVQLQRNGDLLFEKQEQSTVSGEDPVIAQLKTMPLSGIRKLVEEMTAQELAFLWDGVEMNERLSDYSETVPTGVGIADTLRQHRDTALLSDTLLSRILVRVASAAESRLDGCPLPTMSSAGAGTKGLVAILPVSETARFVGATRLQTLRALAFAHLVNAYINAWIGKLSPMCSCVMAASTAASAAIVYLLGGEDDRIGHAVRNMCGTVTGMLCDGGKVGCALKVSTGSAAALLCALTALNGAALRTSDGICAETPEQCIQNMARIGIQGMAATDAEILSVMTDKQRANP